MKSASDSDITGPKDCAASLRRLLVNLVLELSDVAQATILEEKYNVLMRVDKVTETVAAGAAQSKSKPAKSDASEARCPSRRPVRLTFWRIAHGRKWWWDQVQVRAK